MNTQSTLRRVVVSVKSRRAARQEVSEAYREIAATINSHRYSQQSDQNIKRFESKISS